MTNRDFTAWCKAATEKIRYGPDREAVRAELQAHLEDKYDALIARGMTPEEAAAKALESMGSAAEIAPQLGAIHRPWLGYLYSLMKFLGISTGLLAAGALCLFLYGSFGSFFVSEQPYLPRIYENISYYCEPELSAYVDGYRIRIEEAAVGEYEDDVKAFFQMKIRWWPWLEDPKALDDFWAVDSLGNYYDSQGGYREPRVVRHGSTGGGYRLDVTIALNQFDPLAKWVELCYDRDGRNIVFRIELTGGERP